MNRIDRLFAITLLLQARRRMRAQDLARVFEVTERTIYRDMAALSESGVPVVALPGEGYELAEGFYLPPLRFTPDEAAALFLGAQMLGAHAVGRLAANAQRSLDKIAIVLPKPLRAEMERLSESSGSLRPALQFDLDQPRLATLQQAIQEPRVVWIRYHTLEGNEVTEREIEPHALSFFNGAWYVSAYCRLRQAIRSFRLSRIDELKLLRTHFDRRMPAQAARQPLTVRIRFATEVARWVRERQHYGFQCEEAAGADTDVGVIMTYLVDSLSEFKPWLLAWGAAAEPLEPPQLRAEIRSELETWQKILT